MRAAALRIVLLIVALASLRWGIAPVLAEAPPKAVLILSEGSMVTYSAGPVPPTTAVLRAGIIAALRQSPAPLNIYEETIDRVRFDSADYDRHLLGLYKAKYSSVPPDLIIALTEPALDFALRHRAELFPASPLLFGALDERAIADRPLGANVTGVFLHYDVRATVEAALRLHPSTREVVVVGGTSRLDRGYLDIAKEDVSGMRETVSVRYIPGSALSEVLAAVAALPPDALVVFLSMQADGSGVARSGPDVMAELRRVAKVPIYGMSGNFLGLGMAGGMLFDNPTHAADVARRALHILSGAPAGSLVPIASVNALKFDARELSRFGIDAASLPPGATIINREASVWSSYRRTIVLGGALLIGQTMLIAGLMLQARRRRKAERALLDRQEELHRSQARYTLAATAGAVGIWDWNFETHELFIDPVLKGVLGFEEHEISTRPDDWGSRVHPEDVAASAAAAKACFDGHTDSYEATHRMIHKDGSVRWMLSRGSAVRSADGTLRRLVGTKVDITQRRQAEEVVAESRAVLRRRNQEIQELAGRLIEAQEGERARIARDLHDDLSQQIAGLSIALSSLKRRLAASTPGDSVSRAVAYLQERTVGLAEHLRRLAHDLHPSVLEHAGLIPALRDYCAELSRAQPITVNFSAEGTFEPDVNGTALCLYRVAQESLRNVITHAQAKTVNVCVRRAGERAELTIADDGRGFDVVAVARHSPGLGLVSITERIRLAGGSMSVVSELTKGTRIHVEVPTIPQPEMAQWSGA